MNRARRLKQSAAGPASAPLSAVLPPRPAFWNRSRLALAVVGSLSLQWALAVQSLLSENPTIDEVVHLPAGISYWEKGTFRLYPHNPPLIKLLAAWPVVRARPITGPLYADESWGWSKANKAAFAHGFAELNAARYFELFDRARLVMPIFGVIGGLAVFFWSRRLYGAGGGLLSLALWCLCPNILAHERLVTSDVAAASLGCLATFLFWRHLKRPSWANAVIAGLALGMAELAKFSLLLLYLLWPVLWLLNEALANPATGRLRRSLVAFMHGVFIIAISFLVINIGYGFEGSFRPLGGYEFACDALTSPRKSPVFMMPRPKRGDVLDRIREYRVNRFKGTLLGQIPVPLPRYYVTGFDEQKLEADGVRARFIVDPPELGDAMGRAGDVVHGYPVYLDGVLRDRSWWDYYLRALAYKLPEGTWLLLVLSFWVLITATRNRARWADELALWLYPVIALGVMSFATNINLGLRYVLPALPFLFVGVGKVVPWVGTLGRGARVIAATVVVCALLELAAATFLIHPHHLAYFNWISGGPDRGSEHLIDSNLDWGQDLVGLREWAREHAANERIGVAYFGQINPDIFALRGDPLDWFLPPARPGTMPNPPPEHLLGGRGSELTPGVYAVSASLLRGLDWRVYAPGRRSPFQAKRGAYRYFEGERPIDAIGHSILIYRLDANDVRRITRDWPRGSK